MFYMTNKNKKIIICIIAIFVVLGFSINQQFFPTIPKNNNDVISDQNNISNPNTAQSQGYYEWNSKQNMMIDADPNNNRTITTLYNDTSSYEIDSKFNHSQSTTILDDTKNLIMEADTTTLYNITPSTKVEIDHTFDDNSLDITTPTVDVHTEAKGDYDDKVLTSFNLKVNSTIPNSIELDYVRDNPKGHLLTVNTSNSAVNTIANITYDEIKNKYYWNESLRIIGLTGYISEYYAIINESGVWVNAIKIIDWKDGTVSRYNKATTIQMINITEADNNTIILRYSVITFPSPVSYPIYELIFTKTGSNNITMEYLLINPNDDFSFVWEYNIISIFGELGEPAIVVIFYLWYIASDKLYIFLASDFEIEFHWTVIIIYVVSIVIKIWLIEELNYIYWEIEYIWLAWIISIEIWFDLNALTLLAYLITIKFSIYIHLYLKKLLI